MKGGKDRSSSSKQVEFLDQMQVWQLIIEGDKREGWLNRRSCRLQHNSEKFSTSLDGKSHSRVHIWKLLCQTGFPGGSEVKASACTCRRPGFDPWVGKIPWRRKWQPTPVFLPGESHGLRSLVNYSPQCCKESDTTEQLHFHSHFVRQKQCCLFSAMQNRCLGAAQGEIYPVSEWCDGFKILAAGVSKPIHCSQCISLEGRSEQHTSMTATLGMKIVESVKNCCCGEQELAQ